MHALEHRIPPPILMLLVAVLMGLTAHWTTSFNAAPILRYALTGLFLVLGGIIGPPAFRAFNHAGTTINPVGIDQASALVTTGVYRYTRNPMYVGLTALLLALAAFLANPWATVGPVFFVLFITRFQIIPEERVMEAKFGTLYQKYKDGVRRWL